MVTNFKPWNTIAKYYCIILLDKGSSPHNVQSQLTQSSNNNGDLVFSMFDDSAYFQEKFQSKDKIRVNQVLSNYLENLNCADTKFLREIT